MDNLVVCCKECVLHAGLPGITINDEGVCTECEKTESENVLFRDKYRRFRIRKMENIPEKARNRKSLYDVIVLFSGGKDSTYLLDMAKNKYNLKNLFDNNSPYYGKGTIDNLIERLLNIKQFADYFELDLDQVVGLAGKMKNTG